MTIILLILVDSRRILSTITNSQIRKIIKIHFSTRYFDIKFRKLHETFFIPYEGGEFLKTTARSKSLLIVIRGGTWTFPPLFESCRIHAIFWASNFRFFPSFRPRIQFNPDHGKFPVWRRDVYREVSSSDLSRTRDEHVNKRAPPPLTTPILVTPFWRGGEARPRISGSVPAPFLLADTWATEIKAWLSRNEIPTGTVATPVELLGHCSLVSFEPLKWSRVIVIEAYYAGLGKFEGNI